MLVLEVQHGEADVEVVGLGREVVGRAVDEAVLPEAEVVEDQSGAEDEAGSRSRKARQCLTDLTRMTEERASMLSASEQVTMRY